MTNGRPVPKSPGRTPPFILVGLLVLLCVLAYNYWTLSAKNGDLAATTERLQAEAKSVSAAHDSVQRSLEAAQEKLRITEGNLDQVRQVLKEKEGELENIRSDISKVESEKTKGLEDLAKCDKDLVAQGENFEALAAEKKTIEDELANLKLQQNTCGPAQCQSVIQNLIATLKTVIDPGLLSKALNNPNIKGVVDMASARDQVQPLPNADGQPAPNVEGNAGAQPPQNADVQPPQNADAQPPQNAGDGVVNMQLDNQPKEESQSAKSEKEAYQVVGKTESTNITKPLSRSFPMEAGTALPLVVHKSDEKKTEEERQTVKGDTEIVIDASAGVVKQNKTEDHMVNQEVASSKATAAFKTEERANSTEAP